MPSYIDAVEGVIRDVVAPAAQEVDRAGSFPSDGRSTYRRLEPRAEFVVSRDAVRDADPPCRLRADRLHDQRERHGRRCVVEVRTRSMSVRSTHRMLVRVD